MSGQRLLVDLPGAQGALARVDPRVLARGFAVLCIVALEHARSRPEGRWPGRGRCVPIMRID
jgi:hypothetical protein